MRLTNSWSVCYDYMILKLIISSQIDRRKTEKPRKYIEDIQMFLLTMAFISSSEMQNIYIS